MKEELQSAMSARNTYNKAKEEKNKANEGESEIFSIRNVGKVWYIKMNIKEAENGTQQKRHLRKRPQGHQQKTNRPFKQKRKRTGAERQKCQTEEKKCIQ